MKRACGLLGVGRRVVFRLPELPVLLFSRRARQAVRGLRMLERVYERVVVMATLEGARPVRRVYYEGYVDALRIVSAKACLIARTL